MILGGGGEEARPRLIHLFWRPCSHTDHNIPSHNDLPLLLRELFQNKLQDVNLHNFTRGQTSLDRLRDGLVGAQVTQYQSDGNHKNLSRLAFQ